MDKTQALQNLLNGTASEEDINLLKGGLASGEISIGGNVNQSVIIIGSGNTVELPPAALDKLGGRSLLGDLDRDLTGDEIASGLNRLEAELPLRAPVLISQFQEQTRRLRPSLKTNSKSLSDHARRERIEALAQIKSMCMEALDISFNALCLGEEPPEYDVRSPFRGLESFRPEDHEFFFGREALTRKLVSKIQSHPFLAVLGASGSGKSSLVMAGLIPALGLDYAIFRPGTNPLEALETVKENILVVVDQFEELFTLTRDEATRKEFITKLLEITKQNKVVITLRSDFLGEVGAYRSLKEEIQSHLEIVPPMNMDELHRAMEGQAGQVGLRFEADLSQQILDDVEGEPGAMPLLQHALWELWNRRHGRNLRASEYRAFGGVKQAITSTAEKIYGECTKEEQEQLRDIFLRLTRLDDNDEGRDTRRRVPLSDLVPLGRDVASITLLLDKLANARLIVKTVNDNKTEVEVTHEALIRHWERLRVWLNEDRDNLRLRESVIEDARDWENAGKDEILLNHRGGRLDDAVSLGDDARYGLTEIEQAYLNACVTLRNQEQRERERRLRYTVIASIVVAVIFLVLGGFGLVKSNEATNQATIALARQLSAQAQLLSLSGNSKQMVAVILAVQSTRILPSGESAQVLQNNTLASPVSYMRHDKVVRAVRFTPDGKYIVSGGDDGAVRVWDVIKGEEVSHMMHGSWVWAIALSPDGNYVASGSIDGDIKVWETVTGKEITSINTDSQILSLAFSQNGKYIVSGECDQGDFLISCSLGSASTWKILTGEKISSTTYMGSVHSVSFSPDDRYVVSGSDDKTVSVWEVLTGNEISRVKHDHRVRTVAFSPTGKYVVSGSADGIARIWEPLTEREVARVVVGGSVNSIAISPDGKYVALGCGNSTVRIFDIDAGREISIMKHNDAVYSVAFSIDGNYVASGSADDTARVWDTLTGEEIARITHEDDVETVAFSPDGRYVASGSADNFSRVGKIDNGKEVTRMTHESGVLSAAFSLNGNYIISHDEKVSYLWNAALGKEIMRKTWGDTVNSIAISPDSQYIASAVCELDSNNNCAAGKIHVWEATTGKEITQMKHDNTVWQIAFSPDGKFLVSTSSDNSARVWEVSTGEEVFHTFNDDIVPYVGFSPDDKYLFVIGNDTVYIYSMGSWQEIARLKHDNKVSQIAFSLDGKHIISNDNNALYIWEVATEKIIIQMDDVFYARNAIFSPDGKNVAIISPNETIRVLDVVNLKEIANMTHDDWVSSVVFSPDGKYVVSGSRDMTARVWEVTTEKEVARMTHAGEVYSANFSSDGKYVLSGGDVTARKWIWRSEDLIAEACSRVTRNLTRAEWDQYIGDVLPYQAICPNLPIEPEPIPTP